MITESDLQEAIAECLGQRSPNASTCIKLAAFYTIRDQLYGQKPEEAGPPLPAYSFAAAPEEKIKKYGNSPFLQAVEGENPDDIFPILDEIFTALMAVNPRLYDAALRKLSQK